MWQISKHTGNISLKHIQALLELYLPLKILVFLDGCQLGHIECGLFINPLISRHIYFFSLTSQAPSIPILQYFSVLYGQFVYISEKDNDSWQRYAALFTRLDIVQLCPSTLCRSFCCLERSSFKVAIDQQQFELSNALRCAKVEGILRGVSRCLITLFESDF